METVYDWRYQQYFGSSQTPKNISDGSKYMIFFSEAHYSLSNQHEAYGINILDT